MVQYLLSAAAVLGLLLPAFTLALDVEVVGNVDGVAFENLVVRPNQQVLVTTAFPRADIWLFDTFGTLPDTPLRIAGLPGASSSLGISDLGRGHSPEVYYVLGGNFSLSTFTPVPNSFILYAVDMRTFASCNGTVQQPPKVTVATTLNVTTQPNGMTRYGESVLLIGDSNQGAVWAVDLTESSRPKVTRLIQNPSMAPNQSAPLTERFGINGLRAYGNTLFYCNSGFETMWSLPLKQVPGSNVPVPAGPPHKIATNCFCDDFAVDGERGMLWVASPGAAVIGVNITSGAQSVIAGALGDPTAKLSAASSAQLGLWDRYLYVTLTGSASLNAPSGWRGLRRMDLTSLTPKRKWMWLI